MRRFLEPKLILAPPDEVLAEREPLPVGGHFGRADLIKLLARRAAAGGTLVAVENDLLGSVERGFAARKDRVLLAGLEPCVIPVAVLEVGHAGIVGFQARDDLGVEHLAQAAFEVPFLVVILGLEIGPDPGISPLVVPHPVKGIHPHAMRRRDGMGSHLRQGRGVGAECPRGSWGDLSWRGAGV